MAAYPGVEEVARIVCAIGSRVTLIVSCVCKALSGAEIHVEGGTGLEFDSHVCSAVRGIDGTFKCYWAVKTGLSGGYGACH